MPKVLLKHVQRTIIVLHVSPAEEDHRSLEQIFRHTNWQLHQVYETPSVTAILKQVPVSVILFDGDLNPDGWKDLLKEISILPVPPQLIVTSRLADSPLWGEVINLGASDLLAKPFDLKSCTRSAALGTTGTAIEHAPANSRP